MPAVSDVICSIHVPAAFATGFGSAVSPVPNGCSGLYRPKNGAAPFWMGVVASSAKIVFTKFWPVPARPTCVNSGSTFPFGAISAAWRSAGREYVMLS